MNKVFLMGRLTKEPDVREKVTRFTLAVDRYKEGTDFISCVAFSKTAEIIGKYVGKGNKIAIEGRIQTGSYEKDGRSVYTTDVIVERVEFCEKKEKNNDEWMDVDTEGLPFD